MSADLPVEDLVVSYSELASWRKCQFQHWLAYRHRYTPTGVRAPLERGIAWDEVMNLHYEGIRQAHAAGAKRTARLEHPRMVQAMGQIALLLEDDRDQPQPRRDLNDLLRWMYEGYLERWGGDSTWDVKGVQHRGVGRLWVLRLEDRLLQIHLKVILDLVVNVVQRQRVIRTELVDHKSTTTIGHNRDADMDDQQGLYEWYASLGVWPEPIHGTLLNYALARRNKTKPQDLDTRFKRVPANRNETELANIASDAIESAVQAYSQPIEWVPPRSPHPEWCRRECDFLTECLMGRRGHNIHRLLRRNGFQIPDWFGGDKRPLTMDEFLDVLPD